MKKATSDRRPRRNSYAARIAKHGARLHHGGPSAATLAELPELDFSKVRLRRNPFAPRIAKEGVELAHETPSRRSLAELPEADFARLRLRRNQYVGMKLGPGRPRRGQKVEPAPARSVRLPEQVWRELSAEARRSSTTVHGLVRQAVVEFLEEALRSKARRPSPRKRARPASR